MQIPNLNYKLANSLNQSINISSLSQFPNQWHVKKQKWKQGWETYIEKTKAKSWAQTKKLEEMCTNNTAKLSSY